MSKDKLFLIDGSAVFYRSYYAFIRNPLINSKGENTSATFGFLSTLFKLIEDEKPQYLAVIFDTKEPTFRHEMYHDYKATREKMPEEMSATFPRLIEALKTMKVSIFDKAGYEADDIIATVCNKTSHLDLDVYILSGDKDLAQLVNDKVFLYNPPRSGRNNPEILDHTKVKEKYGVTPEQILDYLTLMGDSSDNIPGVPGIGKKRAVELVTQFNDFDNIYRNLESVKSEKIKNNLVEYKEQAILSKRLVLLEKNTPIDFHGF